LPKNGMDLIFSFLNFFLDKPAGGGLYYYWLSLQAEVLTEWEAPLDNAETNIIMGRSGGYSFGLRTEPLCQVDQPL